MDKNIGKRTPLVVESLFLMVLLGAIAGCASAPVSSAGPPPFDTYEIALASDARPTILVGHFSGGEFAEVAVFSRREGRAALELFRFEGDEWTADSVTLLPEDVYYVEKIAGVERDFLLAIGRDELRWIEPGAPTTLAAQVSLALPLQPPDDLPRLAIARDVNRDGFDDIVLPSIDGFDVRLHREPGRLAEGFFVDAPEPYGDEAMWGDERPYRGAGINAQTNPWYQARLYLADANGDGREDLLVWRDGAFAVHHQLGDGTFDEMQRLMATDVAFDADGVYTLAFAITGENVFALMLGLRSSMRHTVLRSLDDINGDAIPDLTTVTFSGRSVIRLKRVVGIHYGEHVDGRLHFAATADTTVEDPRKTAFGYQSAQFRPAPDGGTDVLVGHVSTGATQIFRVFVGNAIAVDLALYRLEDGVFPKKPSARYSVRPDFAAFSRRGPFFPTALFGDLTGDGVADLLVSNDRESLTLYRGRGDADVIEETGTRVPFEVTNNENDAQLVHWRRGAPFGVVSPRPRRDDDDRVSRIGILMPRVSGV